MKKNIIITLIVALLTITNFQLNANWISSTISNTGAINHASFPNNSSLAYVLSTSSNSFLRSSNLFQSFTQIAPLTLSSPRTVFFLNENEGYFLTSSFILKTTNSGQNWNTTALNISIAGNAMAFSNSANGIIAGESGRIVRTVDAGNTWFLSFASGTSSLNSVRYIDANIVVVVGNNGTIFRSTNAGDSWSQITTGSSQNFKSVSFRGSTGIIVGDNGTILRSTNGGLNWSPISTTITNNLNFVSHATNDTIFIAGNNGVILRSVNAGANWEQQVSNNNVNLHTILFKNSQDGIATGDNGVILRTNLGGRVFSPNVNITAPTSNQVFRRTGGEIPLRFISQDISNVIARISFNGGIDNYSRTIGVFSVSNGGTNISLDNTYNLTANARIMLESLDTNMVKDTSDAFIIDEWQLNWVGQVNSNTYYTGLPVVLSWASASVSNVDLEYKLQNQTTWNTIASNLSANNTSYTWTIPDIGNQRISLRIKDVLYSYRNDTTVNQINILNQSVILTNPNASTSFSYPSNINIAWSNSPNVNAINLSYSINNIENWTTISNNVSSSLSSFNWVMPNINASNVRIRLQSSNSSSVSSVSPLLTFIGLPIQISSPTGGVSWNVGSSRTISWVTDNNPGLIRLEYTTDAGVSWRRIADSVLASDLTFRWTIPNEPTSLARIRIVTIPGNNISLSPQFSISNLRFSSNLDNRTLVATTTDTLRFSSFGINTLRVKYRNTSSSSWTTIQDNISSTITSLTRQVPNIAQIGVRIRIESTADTSVFSDLTNNIAQASFSFTSPINSSFFRSNRQTRITWNAAYLTNIRLDHSTDGGNNWNLVISNTNAGTGFYNWAVPNVSSTMNRIRATYTIGNNPTQYQILSDTFNIINSDITLTSLNGNERIYPTQSRQIKWKYTNLSNVDILYTIDGENFIDIANSISAVGRLYNWTIPNNPTTKGRIRIRNSAIPIIFDDSDTTFTIAGVKVTEPNPSSTLLVNTITNIRWNHALVNKVNVFYSIDNGANWITIARDYPAQSGTLVWRVPNNPAMSARIKVVDAENSTLKDSTANIVLQGLKLTNPDSTSNWLIGETYPIRWKSASIGEVKLDYSIDGGTNWITEMSSLDASDSVYNWVVPELPTNRARIRITHLENPSFFDETSNFTIRGNGIVIKNPTRDTLISVPSGTLSFPIRWSHSNVNTINIYASSDNGLSYSSIATNIAASSRSYSWVLNANTITSSKEYRIVISDYENETIADTSAVFSVRGASGYRVPNSWTFTPMTGSNSTVLIPNKTSGIMPRIMEDTIRLGDAIGVFFRDGNLEKCAGYITWDTTNNNAINIWGDNLSTAIKDGYATNETYVFKIWDAQNGVEYNTNVEYSSGNSFFSTSSTNLGLSVISFLRGHKSLKVPIRNNRWTLISTNLLPKTLNIDTVMSSIRFSINQMRDENGNSYMPNNSVNQLTNYNMSLGYEIFLNSSNTWSIEGANINPANYSRTLTANRWHIIPVLRTQDIATTTFLSSYGSSILMMKDSDGNIYYPSFSINQIPTVKVGQAYKIYASNTVSFTNMIAPQTASKFDKSNTLASKAKPMLSSNENVAFVTKYKSTGSSSVLVVEGKELEFGDEIGIFNHLGMVVGSSVVVDTKTPIVIWGDDLQSSAVDGAKDDEILTIKKWSRKENKISTLVFENISDIGKSNELGNTLRYSKDAILFSKVAAVPLGIEFPSDANFAFPNPTADYLNISKELDYKYINLYNLDGRLLSKIERGQTIDMQQYANGIYSLEIVSEVGVTWQKVMKISK